MNQIRAFVIDYCRRHKHPANAVLHVFGVPAVFVGIYLLFAHQPALGAALIVIGYILQYLGHRTQGNEVGEVTMIKWLWRRMNAGKGAVR
jgi:uncharacterized membrane protein YGL010W